MVQTVQLHSDTLSHELACARQRDLASPRRTPCLAVPRRRLDVARLLGRVHVVELAPATDQVDVRDRHQVRALDDLPQQVEAARSDGDAEARAPNKDRNCDLGNQRRPDTVGDARRPSGIPKR